MPRSPRLHAPDLLYHVFARGNNRESIFFEDSDYQRFLSNLEKFRITLEYTIYAYCLLPNHFHILIQVNKINLSKIMQILMTAYTMFINRKYGRVGHVFQGRFQSIIVEKETYLLQVQRYIHLNPVKARLVNRPETYPWSSYNLYFTKGNGFSTINTSVILDMFSNNTVKQKHLFHEFTLVGLKEEFDPVKEQVRGVLGSAKFAQKLTKVLKGIRP